MRYIFCTESQTSFFKYLNFCAKNDQKCTCMQTLTLNFGVKIKKKNLFYHFPNKTTFYVFKLKLFEFSCQKSTLESACAYLMLIIFGTKIQNEFFTKINFRINVIFGAKIQMILLLAIQMKTQYFWRKHSNETFLSDFHTL